ncbi:MAG: alpha/beta hydrolase [Balneolaceae bacterium]|nr:alpha/beta hydrolase [Balneolaceae bacterium]
MSDEYLSLETLPPSVRQWKQEGAVINLADIEVFYIDAGVDRRRPAVMLLHGFPTSSYDWHRILPYLKNRRIILLDLPGHGLSGKPADYSYSLMEQADIVEMLIQKLDIDTVDLVAHDMGTSIATELIARRMRNLLHFDIHSLILMNGSIHIELASLTISQRIMRSPAAGLFVRIVNQPFFRWRMSRLMGRQLPDEEYEAMWYQLRYRDGHLRLPQINRYLEERKRYWHRWVGALKQSHLPVLILWGPEDPVAVPAIAEMLHREIPQSNLKWLEGLGHYPQLENPELSAETVLNFWDEG